MSNWDKSSFIEHMRENCSREIAKIGEAIIQFSETHASDISWGRGTDHGTMTFRCNSDYGLLPLFRLSSNGKINLQLNFLRSKNLHKQILEDMIVKLESNFLREYDQESYPSDSYEEIEDLICTQNQLDTFIKTIEGCIYRLKQ